MSTPSEVVAQFLTMWEEPSGFSKAIRAFFTDQTVYVNVGMTRTTGIEESVAIAAQFESGGTGSLKAEILHSAANGNLVLNERIDTMTDPSGKTMEIAVMGIFEVEGDKIVAWRDYFDTAGLFKQMSEANPSG